MAGIFKEEGQYPVAIQHYRQSIRLCPDFADAHSNLGNALKDSGQIEEAMASYQTAIRLRPDFAIAHGNLASCYYDMGNIEDAIKTFRVISVYMYPTCHIHMLCSMPSNWNPTSLMHTITLVMPCVRLAVSKKPSNVIVARYD